MTTRRPLQVVATLALLALFAVVLGLGLSTSWADATQLVVTATGPGTESKARCTTGPVVVANGTQQSGALTSVTVTNLDATACAGQSLVVKIWYADYTTVATSTPVPLATATQTVTMNAVVVPTGPSGYIETALVSIGEFSVPSTWGPDMHIRRLDNARCLVAGQGQTPVASGSAVYSETCGDAAGQRWTFSGSRLMAFGMCLTLGKDGGGVATENAAVTLSTCVAGDLMQTWFRTPQGRYAAVEPTLGGYPVHACLFDQSSSPMQTRSCPLDTDLNANLRWTAPPQAGSACIGSDASGTPLSNLDAVSATTAVTWVEITGFTNADRVACAGKQLQVALFNGNQDVLHWTSAAQTVDARGDGTDAAPQLVQVVAGTTAPRNGSYTVHHAWIAIDGWLIGSPGKVPPHWVAKTSTTGAVKIGTDSACLQSGGGLLVTATCTGSAAQTWTYDGFTLQQSGLCVDSTAAPGEGVRTTFVTCSNGRSQVWLRDATHSSYVVPGRINKQGTSTPSEVGCLDRDAPTKNVQMWGCYGPLQQQWTLPGG